MLNICGSVTSYKEHQMQGLMRRGYLDAAFFLHLVVVPLLVQEAPPLRMVRSAPVAMADMGQALTKEKI